MPGSGFRRWCPGRRVFPECEDSALDEPAHPSVLCLGHCRTRRRAAVWAWCAAVLVLSDAFARDATEAPIPAVSGKKGLAPIECRAISEFDLAIYVSLSRALLGGSRQRKAIDVDADGCNCEPLRNISDIGLVHLKLRRLAHSVGGIEIFSRHLVQRGFSG